MTMYVEPFGLSDILYMLWLRGPQLGAISYTCTSSEI